METKELLKYDKVVIKDKFFSDDEILIVTYLNNTNKLFTRINPYNESKSTIVSSRDLLDYVNQLVNEGNCKMIVTTSNEYPNTLTVE